MNRNKFMVILECQPVRPPFAEVLVQDRFPDGKSAQLLMGDPFTPVEFRSMCCSRRGRQAKRKNVPKKGTSHRRSEARREPPNFVLAPIPRHTTIAPARKLKNQFLPAWVEKAVIYNKIMSSYAFWNNKGGVGKSFLC